MGAKKENLECKEAESWLSLFLPSRELFLTRPVNLGSVPMEQSPESTGEAWRSRWPKDAFVFRPLVSDLPKIRATTQVSQQKLNPPSRMPSRP